MAEESNNNPVGSSGALDWLRRGLIPLASLKDAAVRFPLTLLSAIGGTTLILYQLHSRCPEKTGLCDPRWIAFLLLCIPATFAATLWAERRKLPAGVVHLLSLSVLSAVLLLGSWWIQQNLFDLEFAARVAQLTLVVHLMVAALPALSLSRKGFFQYNRFLFWRFHLLLVFAGVLFLGLAGALGGACYLLGFKVKETRFLDIFFCAFTLYHPLGFLAGVPKVEEFERMEGSSRESDLLCQYLLLPLVGLYFLILYVYLGKILFLWELPRGGVGYLVGAASLVGVLCFLLLEQRIQESWRLHRCRTIFFILLIPMIALLFVGLNVRVTEYGWTEHRYLLSCFGMWLIFLVVYFISAKTRDIRFIPLSLGTIALFTLFGPWSAYELPPYLQRRELEAILVREGMLKDGVGVPADHVIKPELVKDIDSLFSYLLKTSQSERVLAWFPSIKTQPSRSHRATQNSDLEAEILATLKLQRAEFSSDYFNLSVTDRSEPLGIAGFSQFHEVASSSRTGYHLTIEGTRVLFRLNQLTILTFELKSELARLRKIRSGALPKYVAVDSTDKSDKRGRLFVWSISGTWKGDQPDLTWVSGFVLVK